MFVDLGCGGWAVVQSGNATEPYAGCHPLEPWALTPFSCRPVACAPLHAPAPPLRDPVWPLPPPSPASLLSKRALLYACCFVLLLLHCAMCFAVFDSKPSECAAAQSGFVYTTPSSIARSSYTTPASPPMSPVR